MVSCYYGTSGTRLYHCETQQTTDLPNRVLNENYIYVPERVWGAQPMNTSMISRRVTSESHYSKCTIWICHLQRTIALCLHAAECQFHSVPGTCMEGLAPSRCIHFLQSISSLESLDKYCCPNSLQVHPIRFASSRRLQGCHHLAGLAAAVITHTGDNFCRLQKVHHLAQLVVTGVLRVRNTVHNERALLPPASSWRAPLACNPMFQHITQCWPMGTSAQHSRRFSRASLPTEPSLGAKPGR